MTNLHRAQILLEEEQHQALAALARQQKRSISQIVREIVGQYLAERTETEQQQRELQAIAALTALRGQIEERHGVIQQDLLAAARAEREQELEPAWQ